MIKKSQILFLSFRGYSFIGRCAAMSTLAAVFLVLVAMSRSATAGEEGIAECATSQSGWVMNRPEKCLQAPGWFDVGAGIVMIKNAGNAQQNGVGNMVSLRAYPLGRWYAPLKSLPPSSGSLIKGKVAMVQQAKDNLKVSQVKADNAAAAHEEAKRTLDVSTEANAEAIKTRNAALEKVEKLQKETDDANTQLADAKDVVDEANTDIALSMKVALDHFGENYALKEHHWLVQGVKRISVFLGRSVGGFDSKAVDGDINAVGVAFDIAPEFSVIWGRAYYNQLAQAGVENSSKSAKVIGVQINLRAFKAMRGLTGSL